MQSPVFLRAAMLLQAAHCARLSAVVRVIQASALRAAMLLLDDVCGQMETV